MDISEAVDAYIKHVGEMRLNPKEESDYERGLVYEKVPEILTIRSFVNFAFCSPSSPSVGRAGRYCPSCWRSESLHSECSSLLWKR